MKDQLFFLIFSIQGDHKVTICLLKRVLYPIILYRPAHLSTLNVPNLVVFFWQFYQTIDSSILKTVTRVQIQQQVEKHQRILTKVYFFHKNNLQWFFVVFTTGVNKQYRLISQLLLIN